MAKDQDNIRIYGSDDDTVWLAPLGTTLPTDLGDLDPAFEDVGYLSEDGMSLERQADVTEFRAHQGAKVVRKKVTSSGKTFTFRPIEDNETVNALGGDVVSTTTVGDITTTVFSDSSEVTSWACVVDLFDGGVHRRKVIGRLDTSSSGSEDYTNSAITQREVVGTIIGNHTEISGPVA